MNLSLVMFKADGSRREFPVNNRSFVVGRTNHCDLRIPLSAVSRKHCEITIEEDEILVRDLNSSNGTYHNGVRVQEAGVDAGDQISVGPVVFTIVVDGQPADIEPVRSVIDAEDRQGVEDVSASEEIESDTRDTSSDDDDMTLELDDDPIAALEALSEADDDLPLLEDDDDSH